jgi:hypothetical protein
MARGIFQLGWNGKLPYIKSNGRELRDMMPDEKRTTTVLHRQKLVEAKVRGPLPGDIWCYVEYPSEGMNFYAQQCDIKGWEEAAERRQAKEG